MLVDGVAADPNALGYFGYAYYLANKDKLKLVAIDNGNGCVAPSAETVADDSYQPLSRPLFIYVSDVGGSRGRRSRRSRGSTSHPKNAGRVHDVGYVPLPTATLLSVGRRLDTGMTGSMFGGRGSVLGVTAETFQDEDGSRARWSAEDFR